MSAHHLAFSLQSSAFRLFLLISFTFAFLSFTFPAHAADPVTTEPAPKPALEAIDASNYGPDKHLLYTLMNLGGYAAGCFGEGGPLWGGSCVDMVGMVQNGKAQGATPYLVDSSIKSGGALGALGGAMVAMSVTPPTSPVQYLASIGENFGIKPAYAQVSGSGNSVIEPILKLWQLTRNISYFGFILIFMVVGFMIMFRQKLNPQTVISAQNALPGIVVALILVTFSYFIAALIIDFGFITTQLTGRFLVANGLANEQKVNETLQKRNLFDMFGAFIAPSSNDLHQVASGTAQSVEFLNHGFAKQLVQSATTVVGCYAGANHLPGLIGPARLAPLGAIGSGLLGCGIGAGAGLAVGTYGTTPIFYGLGVVLYLVLLIALLIAMGKTFFELIKAYVTIMIQTVIGPIIILAGAIPGQGGTFSGWAKTLLANVLIFPAVFSAFFFAAFIRGKTEDVFGIPQNSAGDFSQITSTVPLLGGLTGEFIHLILAYGILLMIPSIPGEIKKAFKVQDSPLGGAALGTLAGGFALGRATASKYTGSYQKDLQAIREARLKRKAESWSNDAAPLPADAPWHVRWFGRR